MKFKKIEKYSYLLFVPFIIFYISTVYMFENKINQFQETKQKKQLVEENHQQNLITDFPNHPQKKFFITIDDDEILPKIINAKINDLLIFKIKVNEGYHNIHISGYEIKSKNIPTNKLGELIFLASQSGSFKITSQTGKYTDEPEAELIIE